MRSAERTGKGRNMNRRPLGRWDSIERDIDDARIHGIDSSATSGGQTAPSLTRMSAVFMSIDFREFSSNRVYNRTAGVDAIVADMAELSKFDAYHEAKQRQWTTLLIVFAIVACVALVALVYSSGAVQMVGIAVCLAGSLATIAALFKRSAHKRLNIEDRRYLAVGNLLPLLGSDIAPEATVHLRIDFNPSDHRSKFQRKGRVNDWKVKYYSDPWLEIRGRFVDGTAFLITLVYNLQLRSKWKRSYSGKMKHKTKQKIKTVLSVRLKAKPTKYPRLPQVMEGAKSAVQLAPGATLLDLRASGHSMSMKVSCRSFWQEPEPGEPRQKDSVSNTFAMMLVSMYQVLNLAKDISERNHAA